MLGKGLSELSHLENLPQRLPIVLAAALIAGAAVALATRLSGSSGGGTASDSRHGCAS